jgi:hypothetical protein
MSAIDFYCTVDKIKGADGKDCVVVTHLKGSIYLTLNRFASSSISPVSLFLISLVPVCTNSSTEANTIHMVDIGIEWYGYYFLDLILAPAKPFSFVQR